MIFKLFVVIAICILVAIIIATMQLIIKLNINLNNRLNKIEKMQAIDYLKLWAEYYMSMANDKIEEDSTLYKNTYKNLHHINEIHNYGVYNSIIHMLIQIEYTKYNACKNFNLSEANNWFDEFNEEDLCDYDVYYNAEDEDYYDDMDDSIDYDEYEEDAIAYNN